MLRRPSDRSICRHVLPAVYPPIPSRSSLANYTYSQSLRYPSRNTPLKPNCKTQVAMAYRQLNSLRSDAPIPSYNHTQPSSPIPLWLAHPISKRKSLELKTSPTSLHPYLPQIRYLVPMARQHRPPLRPRPQPLIPTPNFPANRRNRINDAR